MMTIIRPVYHIFILYALIAMLVTLQFQRYSVLRESQKELKEFQKKSSGTRLYFLNEIDELQNRLAVLEHKNGIPHIRTVRPIDADGNHK
jgi:phage-related protein